MSTSCSDSEKYSLPLLSFPYLVLLVFVLFLCFSMLFLYLQCLLEPLSPRGLEMCKPTSGLYVNEIDIYKSYSTNSLDGVVHVALDIVVPRRLSFVKHDLYFLIKQ